MDLNDDLRQLSIGSVTTKSYGPYDVNVYRFRSSFFESSHPMAVTQKVESLPRQPTWKDKKHAITKR